MADRLTQLQDAVNQVSVLRSEEMGIKTGESFFFAKSETDHLFHIEC